MLSELTTRRFNGTEGGLAGRGLLERGLSQKRATGKRGLLGKGGLPGKEGFRKKRGEKITL